jgi:hypothetical protein
MVKTNNPYDKYLPINFALIFFNVLSFHMILWHARYNIYTTIKNPNINQLHEAVYSLTS